MCSRYNKLRTVLRENAAQICDVLEPLLSVKQKKEVAKILVNITQCEGKATPFLNALILSHIKTIGKSLGCEVKMVPIEGQNDLLVVLVLICLSFLNEI